MCQKHFHYHDRVRFGKLFFTLELCTAQIATSRANSKCAQTTQSVRSRHHLDGTRKNRSVNIYNWPRTVLYSVCWLIYLQSVFILFTRYKENPKKLKRQRYKGNKNERKEVIKYEYITIQVKCTECHTSGAFSVVVHMFLNLWILSRKTVEIRLS